MTSEHYYPPHELATLFLDWIEDQGGEDGAPVNTRDRNYEGPCEAIDPNAIPALAQGILDFVANVVSTIIDAGSERDAVNENEELLAAIADELRGWTITEGIAPEGREKG